MNAKKDLNFETRLMHDADLRNDVYGAVVPPIYQNSLFTFDSWEAIDEAFEDRVNNAIYTRGNNPTVALVEKKIAALAGAGKAKLFASGMAAISAGMLHFLKAGDHVITLKNIYGPSGNLLRNYFSEKMKIETTFLDSGNPEEIAAAVKSNTRLIYLESPSSVVFGLQDLATVAELARKRGIATMIDNTWATPVFQKPFAFGIDLEVHSCSKYLGGHSDIVAGVLIGSSAAIDAIQVNEYELLGAKMAPMEAWFLLRSLRTLPLRLARHQESALKIARFLETHEKITEVKYPGLESFPQYALGQRQMTGYTGLMSFRLASCDLNAVKLFFNSLKIFQIGVSWGGHESLVYAPAISYLKEIAPDQFARMGISIGDIRISVGLEDADDLMDDLSQALSLI